MRLRWYVCGLLFFATTINYIDRQVLGLLKPVLERDLHWKEAEYGWVVFSFQLAYAAVMPRRAERSTGSAPGWAI